MTPKITLKKNTSPPAPWFSIGSWNGEYFIEYFERGEETKIQTSYHGVIKLREHFLALGYEWR